MSDDSWTVPEKPVYVLCNPPEKDSITKGLLWGHGDPDFAELQSYDYWAVVKLQAYREAESNGRRCVEFKDGETVFEGARVDAIETLISLGADPARVSVEVQVNKTAVEFGSDAPLVRTGDCGTSIVADYGIARAERRGHAVAGDGGIAWAGPAGYAKAGDGGLAITDGIGGGTAIAGDGGIAIGSRGFNKVSAGRGGIAIAHIRGKISVGDRGIGICRISGRAQGDSESIVIGDVVSGDMGSLLVARKRNYGANGLKWQVAYGYVGQDGIRPGARYTVKDNKLVEETDEEVNERNRRWFGTVAAAIRARDAGGNK